MKSKLLQILDVVLMDIRVKAVIVVVVVLSLFVIYYIPLSKFNTQDPKPKIEIITMEQRKEFRAFSVKVATGLYVKNFTSFDMIKNNFTVDAIVWFEYNPDEIMLDTISQFTFLNGKIIKKSPPDIRLFNDKVFVKYDVIVEIKSDIAYHTFPLEDHRLSIVLGNDFVTPDEMYFVVRPTGFGVSPSIFTSNWKVKDLSIDAGYAALPLDSVDETKTASHPRASFTINFEKASIRKVLIIFIPLFSLALLSLLSSFMTIGNARARIVNSVSSFSALLGYRFVIESIMPEVGYFTTTDLIYIFCLMFTFIGFIFQLFFTRRSGAFESAKTKAAIAQALVLERINGVFFLLMSIFMVAVVAIIVL